MRLIQPIVVSVIASLVAIPVFADDVKPDPREKLETAIPVGIRLLEEKKYEVFVKSFVPPADLKKIKQGTSLEEFAKRFGERKAPKLLDVLKEIKDAKPNFYTGTKGTFALKKEISGKKSITFVKVEKYWYIQN